MTETEGPNDHVNVIRDFRLLAASIVDYESSSGRQKAGIPMARSEIEVGITIEAPIAKVWHAVQDPKVHAVWNPLIRGIQGKHAMNEVRHCDVQFGRRAGKTDETCVEFEAEKRILWRVERDTMGMTTKLKDARGGFAMRDAGEGRTHVKGLAGFTPGSWFMALMAPMARRQLRQMHVKMTQALKAYLETGEIRKKGG